MQVALDRADDDRADPRAARLGQERLEHLHAGLHRPRGDQHLGDVDHVVLEVLADDGHPGDQPVFQDFLERNARGQGLFGHPLHVGRLARVKKLVHQRVIDEVVHV